MNASTEHTIKLSFFALATLAALAVATDALFVQRAQLPPPQRLTVNYTDLDMNSADGAAVLYHRIRVAANQVCGVYDTRDLTQAALRRSCTERAVAQAVASVNNPRLSDQYLNLINATGQRALVAAR